MNKPGRPSKFEEPPKSGKKGKSIGSAGGFAPTYETTALPDSGAGGVEESPGYNPGYTEPRLTGFQDTRGGVRKFFDALGGRQSPVDSLNAQWALKQAEDMSAEQRGTRLAELTSKLQGDTAIRTAQAQADIAQKSAQEDLRQKAAAYRPTVEQTIADSDAGRDITTDRGAYDSYLYNLEKQKALDATRNKVTEIGAQGDAQVRVGNNFLSTADSEMSRPLIDASTSKLGASQSTADLTSAEASRRIGLLNNDADTKSWFDKGTNATYATPWGALRKTLETPVNKDQAVMFGAGPGISGGLLTGPDIQEGRDKNFQPTKTYVPAKFVEDNSTGVRQFLGQPKMVGGNVPTTATQPQQSAPIAPLPQQPTPAYISDPMGMKAAFGKLMTKLLGVTVPHAAMTTAEPVQQPVQQSMDAVLDPKTGYWTSPTNAYWINK